MRPLHCDLKYARLSTWAKTNCSEDELDRAEKSLWRMGYLRYCTNQDSRHMDCVIVVK